MTDFIPKVTKLTRTACKPRQQASDIKRSKTLNPYEEWHLKVFGRLPNNEIQ